MKITSSLLRRIVGPKAMDSLNPYSGLTIVEELHSYGRLTSTMMKAIRSRPEGLLTCGNYTILGVLGQGGAGWVLDAVHSRLGIRAAIKLFPANQQSLAACEQVRARRARQLNQSGLIRVRALGFSPLFGRSIVMERAEGDLSSLEDRSDANILGIGRQIAETLRRLHRLGFIHRDLKPANLFLTRRGVVLGDVGLMRRLNSAAHDVETEVYGRNDSTAGTRPYMPLELIHGHAEPHFGDDLFALACTLAELKLNRRIFTSRHPDVRDKERWQVLELLGSSALYPIVRRGTDPDPHNRYPSARDMLDDLSHVGMRSLPRRRPLMPLGHVFPTAVIAAGMAAGLGMVAASIWLR